MFLWYNVHRAVDFTSAAHRRACSETRSLNKLFVGEYELFYT